MPLGNAASTAIFAALRNRIDLSLSIALGSSVHKIEQRFETTRSTFCSSRLRTLSGARFII